MSKTFVWWSSLTFVWLCVYFRVISVFCQMNVRAIITDGCTTPMTPLLKTATNGNWCSIFLWYFFPSLSNYNISCASLPAVFVRSAGGTAASRPVLVCAWQLVTHTTWRSMAATTLSSVTASMCWWGRGAVCLVSRQRMFPVAALESPVPSQSPSAWEIQSYTCWEVGHR